MEHEILTETETNWLIRTDGEVQTVTKSPTNRLLYEHDMKGVINGDETYAAVDGDQQVLLTPEDGGWLFTVDGANVHVGQQHRPDLIDALVEHIEQGTVAPLTALFEQIRSGMARKEVLTQVMSLPPFDDVCEVQDSGVLFYDHLLLSWDVKFYHPATTTMSRDGTVLGGGTAQQAYQVNIGDPPDEFQEVTFDGERYVLTDKEMRFLAYSLWAYENAPQRAELGRGQQRMSHKS